MSPSEFDLRDALRDGEGDGLNPDVMIASALQIRRTRRTRMGAIAASVVAVGLIGAGTTQWIHSTSSVHAADSAGTAKTTFGAAGASMPNAADATSGGGARNPGPQPTGCPATVPRLAIPGGGGSGLFGSGGPLFSGTVTQIRVCGYPQGAAPTSVLITGNDAAALATSLNAAPRTPKNSVCPFNSAGTGQLVLLATTADGQALPPVVATMHCTWTVTNGTAVRYTWTPPPNPILTGLITAATAGTAGGAGPPHASGSPAR